MATIKILRTTLAILITLFFLLLLLISACTRTTPIEGIVMFKIQPGQTDLPSGPFHGKWSAYPTQAGVYHPGDKIYIVLWTGDKAATITRFTFYYKESRQEMDIPNPPDLIPLLPPKTTVFIAFLHPGMCLTRKDCMS